MYYLAQLAVDNNHNYYHYFETGSHCKVLASLAGTHYVNQAILELFEIHLPLPPWYWN